MSGQTEILSLMAKMRPRKCDFRKIRVGSAADGGYVLPDDCDGLSGIVSLGVGINVSFDEYFARRGVPVYQYDHTVDAPPNSHERFQFNRIAWGPTDGPGVASLETIIKSHHLQDSTDALLKFDTEGAEWEILPSTPARLLQHFRIIVCELHGIHALPTTPFFQQLRQTIELLTRNHTVVHLHANNCCGIHLIEGVPVPAVVELTLLRNDRSNFSPSDEPLPGPLDFPNMDDRPDIVLRPFG